jgi:outer membrane protein TolC
VSNWARLALLLSLLCGCTRAQYRQSADAETYCIIDERIVDPAYEVGRTQLEPEPFSRLADPYDPDFPPKPPDDPAAARWMHSPGYMRGADDWGRDGCTDFIEPIGWEEALAPDASGQIRLNQDAAVDIALLNSREYQSALEDLYLTALLLTLNRFEFDLQWFGRNSLGFTHAGNSSLPNERNTLTNTATLGFSRSFATGGQLLASFANSLVFEYTGANTKVIRSNIVLSLIQPLLRGAGRRVRLENLTQQERNVLYAVRDFARFRKQFWASISTQNGGYLDLLLAIQTVRNNQANLTTQEETYRLYDELFIGGKVSAVERDQFFQSYQAARLAVIQAETSFQIQLDQFKLQLGLPPRLPIELDDSLLKNFELEDERLVKLREQIAAFQTARMAELDALPTEAEFQKHFETLMGFLDGLDASFQVAESDLSRWKTRHAARPAPEATNQSYAREAESLNKIVEVFLPEIRSGLDALPERLLRHQMEAGSAAPTMTFDVLGDDITYVLTQLDGLLAIQTQSRIQLIELPLVRLEMEEGVEIAKAQRLDLQNQKGVVTDAWRKVSVAANALRGGLNLVAGANIGTDPDHLKPFNFSAQASQYTLGVEVDGPLNRMAERNAYRASLIDYQRAKRAYVSLSDNIEFSIRRDLRTLNQLELSFEISRQQLLAAARQLEGTRLTLLGPRDRRSNNDTTTLNLLQALGNLLQARNALAANYINYEQQRVQLLLDLESLRLDSRGFPTDESNRLFSAAADSLSAPEIIPPGRTTGRPGGDPELPGERTSELPGAEPPAELPAPEADPAL